MQDPNTPSPPRSSGPRREPVLSIPGAVTALAGVILAIQLAQAVILNEEGRLALTFWLGFIPLRILYTDAFEGGWLPLLWTPVTHAFLHAGWEHALVNTAWLAIFATPVARRYGSLRFVLLFLLSSAAGAAAFAATTLPEFQARLGASGGVSGLTGAAVRFLFQPVLMGADRRTA